MKNHTQHFAINHTCNTYKNDVHKDIDIHINTSSNITEQIKDFNSFLANSGILKKYDTTPFLEHYPVHLTLYLTNINTNNLDSIKNEVQKIASHWAMFDIITSYLNSNESSFVTLEVNNSNQTSGHNNKLQILSDEVIFSLSPHRNLKSLIPTWAEDIPDKKRSFALYGTPNAFMEFNPHFSVLAGTFETPEKKKEFLTEINGLISEYKYSPIKAKALSLGIGYVDSLGQITEEIVKYPLTIPTRNC